MLKPIAWRAFVRRLREFGFTGPAYGGKHPFMIKGVFKLHIPGDHGKDIGVALLREILRQADIDPKDWNALH